MPNMCEIDALLSGGLSGFSKKGRTIVSAKSTLSDLRQALSDADAKPRSRRSKSKLPPGPSAARMLEIAESNLEKGKQKIALMWGVRAVKRAKAEKKTEIRKRADELVKVVRGQMALKIASSLGDMELLQLGRMHGIW